MKLAVTGFFHLIEFLGLFALESGGMRGSREAMRDSRMGLLLCRVPRQEGRESMLAGGVLTTKDFGGVCGCVQRFFQV